MGETVGSGEVVAKNFNTKAVITYTITIYDASSTTPATQAQVAQVMTALKNAAAANNLVAEIAIANSTLL